MFCKPVFYTTLHKLKTNKRESSSPPSQLWLAIWFYHHLNYFSHSLTERVAAESPFLPSADQKLQELTNLNSDAGW